MQHQFKSFGRGGFIAAILLATASLAFSASVSASDNICITGHKLYDKNTNGVKDGNETRIPGWRIELWKDDAQVAVQFTDAGGHFHFYVPKNSGAYTLKEVPPSPFFPVGSWLNSGPITKSVNVCEEDINLPCFANVCLGEGGAHTLGFWSNKNGQRLMTLMPGGMAGTLAFLRGLNLRDAEGDNFDPTTYTQFRTWLLGANAVNMAYMLSAQYVAMQLNVRSGNVALNSFVYAPGTLGANSFGFASIVSLINEANNELANHGYTPAGDDRRAYQENLKNALDNANNNLTFVQPGPCQFTTPY